MLIDEQSRNIAISYTIELIEFYRDRHTKKLDNAFTIWDYYYEVGMLLLD